MHSHAKVEDLDSLTDRKGRSNVNAKELLADLLVLENDTQKYQYSDSM